MLAEQVLKRARQAGLRICTAESCTGGMIAAALTDIAGSSDVFECSFITYSNQSKTDMLGVLPESLQQYGAVSEPVAREMAAGALRPLISGLAVATTGIAGPGGSEFKPEGRVCFGLARKDGPVISETVEFGPLGRTKVREKARDHALKMLLANLP